MEADWPDAARIDDYVLGAHRGAQVDFTPFTRFPTWMWRNEEVHDFVDWLRAHNAEHPDQQGGFHGLDLYSLFTSIAAVSAYLDEVDPGAAKVARHRYGALTPWQKDPAAYGEAVLVGRYESSEDAVVAMLRDMLERRVEYARQRRRALLRCGAERAARRRRRAVLPRDVLRLGDVVEPSRPHMFDTLRSLLAFYGPDVEGDRVGAQLARGRRHGDRDERARRAQRRPALSRLLGEQAYIIGFGTDHGTVAAASDWDEPMQRMRVVPAREGSYERVFHDAAVRAFALHSAASDGAARSARSSPHRSSSARSASCIDRRRSCRATTSRRAFRASSTSTSGSTRPPRCVLGPGRLPTGAIGPTRTLLACDGGRSS